MITTQTNEYKRPKIVCLCGSTKFFKEFQKQNYLETMRGNIVLSVGFYPHASEEVHGESLACTPEQKTSLDELHKRKIDLADEVFVLDVENYIGDSTRSEIEYAIQHEKVIRYLSQESPERVAPTQKQSVLFGFDATPDSDYVIRILEAYVDDSTYTDNLAGIESTNPLVVMMNEQQTKRNALLRSAIATLRTAVYATKNTDKDIGPFSLVYPYMGTLV